MRDEAGRRPPRRWADLHPEPAPEILAVEKEIDELHRRVFNSGEGRALLTHMRKITIERRANWNDADGALRWMEAQRTFVAVIEARIARAEAALKTNVGRRTSTKRK